MYYYAGAVKDIFNLLSNSSQLGGVGLVLLSVSITVYVCFQLYKFFEKNKKTSGGDTSSDKKLKKIDEIKGEIYSVKNKLKQLKKVPEIEDEVDEIKNDVDKIEEIYSLVRELHRWHDKEDQYGRKIWYVQFTMKEIVNDVLEGVDDIMKLIEKLVKDVEEIQRKQRNKKEDNNDDG